MLAAIQKCPSGRSGLTPAAVRPALDASFEKAPPFGVWRMGAEPVIGARELPGGVKRLGIRGRRGGPQIGGLPGAREICPVGIEGVGILPVREVAQNARYRIEDAGSHQEIAGEPRRRPRPREGLTSTPKRVEKALTFLTSGYDADIDQVLNDALFTVDYSEMVIVKDIDFYSLCEHHLLPFFGKCHVAYIPSNRVIGLSKIPRLVDVFSRRLQIQERLTNQIADTIRDKIAPLGVAVVMEATHLCMSMRGVQKQNSFAVTSAMLGAFRDNARTRMEFLELIKLRSAIPGLGDGHPGWSGLRRRGLGARAFLAVLVAVGTC